jgi:D-proline reductase (dithiol) PrdB
MRREQVPARLAERDCPDFGEPAWTPAPRPEARQVAIVSTAGLIQLGDRPFGFGAADYRIIDAESPADLMMSHISTNFDRTGYLQDHEVVFPLARLKEAAAGGVIGRVARYHYSFMGATSPMQMKAAAAEVARAMTGEGVNIALLVPV